MIDWVGRHGPVQKWKMNFQKNKNRTTTDAHVPKTPDKPKQAHPNPTTTATSLRLEIQKLKDTIATRKKENPHNLELPLLNKLCNQKKKVFIIDNKKQNSALLHKHDHEIKVTPFNATMNTAWELLHDFKSNESADKSQLPSQMHMGLLRNMLEIFLHIFLLVIKFSWNPRCYTLDKMHQVFFQNFWMGRVYLDSLLDTA